MSDYEAFVHELIGYIFKVQDKDDDNLSAEIVCRKLYKYGLIKRDDHKWRMKYRPRYVWPARIRKTEPQAEAPYIDIETGILHWCGWKYRRIYEDEPFDKDINVRSKTEPQTEMEKSGSRAVLTARCLNCHNAKACKENHWEGCRYEPWKLTAIEDEPQTDCSWKKGE